MDDDNRKKVYDSLAKAFKTPSADASASKPSESTDNSAFHKDLEGSICPDCHESVKTVIPPTPSSSSTPSLDPDRVKAVAGSMQKAFGP